MKWITPLKIGILVNRYINPRWKSVIHYASKLKFRLSLPFLEPFLNLEFFIADFSSRKEIVVFRGPRSPTGLSISGSFVHKDSAAKSPVRLCAKSSDSSKQARRSGRLMGTKYRVRVKNAGPELAENL